MPSLPLQIWLLIICVVASTVASPLPFRLSELFGRSNFTTDLETLDERASSPIYVAGAICNAWPANNPTGFKLRVGTLYASCGGHSYKYNDEYKPTGVVSGVDPYYKPECDHVIELQSLLPWIYSTLDTQGFNNMCQALLADSDISNANSMGSRMLAAINTAENLYDIPIAVNQAKKILWNSQTLKTSSLDLGRLALQSYIDAITTQVDSIVTAVTTKLDLAWPQGNGIFVQEADSLTTLFKGKLQTVTTNLATVNAARPPTTNCPARQKLTVVNNVGLPPSTDPADPEAKSVPNPDSVTSDPPPTTTSKRDLMIRNWYLRSASLWNNFIGRSVDRDRQIIRTSRSIHQERAADYSVNEQNNTLALQKRDPASYWVQFCDDNGDNCSISFDIWNPGCFSADGTTVVFHGEPFAALYNLGDVVLVVSPEGGCPCQGSQQDFNVVDLDIDTPYTLTNTGKSYRFVANDDTGNNCPTTSSAVVSSTPSPSSTVVTSSAVVTTDSAVTSSSTLSASSSVVSSFSTQASVSSTPIPSTVSSNSAASSTPSISTTAVSTTATGSSSASASGATSTALPSQAPLLQTQPDPGEAADPDEAADAELVCLDEPSSSSSSSSTTSSTTTSSSSSSTNSDQTSSPSSTPTDTNGDGGGGGGGGFSFPAINLPGFSLPGFHLPNLPGPGGISVTDPAGDVGTILTGAGGAIIVIFGGQSTTVGSLPTNVVEPDLSSKTTTNSAGQTITLYSVQPSATASASSLPATVTPTPAPGSPITITSTGPDGITTLVTTTEGSASAGSPITISTVNSAGVPTVITSIVSAASSSSAVASSTLTTITTTGADGLPTIVTSTVTPTPLSASSSLVVSTSTGADGLPTIVTNTPTPTPVPASSSVVTLTTTGVDGLPTVITSTAGSTPTPITASSSSIVTITSTGVDGLPTIITSTLGMPTPTTTPASATNSLITMTTTGSDGLPTVITTAASITTTPTSSSVASTLPSSAVSSVSSTPPPISSSSPVPIPGSIVTTTTTGVDGLPTAITSTVGIPISSSASSSVTPTPTVGSTVTLTTTGIDGLPTIVTSTVGVATSSTPVLTSISPSSSDVISSSSMSSSSSVVPAPSSTPPPAGSGTYAKFCSDGQQDNCTPGYLISDPTCFTIPATSTGFITFYTQDVPTTDNDNYALVYSPDAACGCQNNVQTVPIAVFNASETTNMQFTGGSYHWLPGVGTANTC